MSSAKDASTYKQAASLHKQATETYGHKKDLVEASAYKQTASLLKRITATPINWSLTNETAQILLRFEEA